MSRIEEIDRISIPTAASEDAVSPRIRALAESMHAFNAFVAAEPRLQVVMLPVRDGLSVIRYRAPATAN